MADFALGRNFTLSRPQSAAIEWVIAHREAVAVGAIMALAAVLRFWALGDKALHHDESLHAQFTYYLTNGTGYKHDPLMHGPFLFEAGAVIFFLFGDSDYTSRILPALFGTALVGMPFLLRRQLGMQTVLIAAVLLCFSPMLLYVSRFDRHDIYINVWTLGIVICIWRYLSEQRSGWLYGMSALLAFSFATMEITYILAAIFLIFVDLILAVELARREDGSLDVGRALALVPIAWLMAAAWPLLGDKPLGKSKLPPAGDVMVVLGTMVLPLFAAALQQVPGIGDQGYNVDAENGLRNTSVLVLMIASAYVGLLWKPKVWLICAACFYIPYILMFTTFFMNQPAPWTKAFWNGDGGFWSGIWGSLDYWLDQHHVKRGNQPFGYYALMTPLYEFLPLLLALGGAAWMTIRGSSLSRWLLFWTFAIFVGLSIAGEKMPWLEVHIALPLALAGAVALSMAINALDFRGSRWLTAASAALAAALAVLLLVEGSGFVRLLGWLAGGVLLGCIGGAALTEGRQSAGRVALAVAVGGIMLLTVRTSLTLSFKNYDTPVEMAVYTQTSGAIPDLQERIDTIAEESGLGYNLPIVVDSSDGYAWPWAWYLRHYHEVSYVNVTANYQPPPGAVLLIDRANVGNVSGAGYSQTPYKHRWWFNETYKAVDLKKAVSILTSPDEMRGLGRFFLYRRPTTKTGSSDAVAYFPDSLAAFDVKREPSGPGPEPVTLQDGRISFGGPGGGRSEFSQPAGLFVDGDRNIWVADSRNNRIQKFDPRGNLIDILGVGGSRPATLKEPWSMVVDREGFLYVADTWNHRILKFSPSLEQVQSWGQPSVTQNPGPFDLFGPRAIALAPDGTLWVTDTGNERIINYSTDGEALRTFGSEGDGPGNFAEPVGLAYDADGRLYVADTWNGRIQRFNPNLGPPTSLATGWNSRDVIAKPYIAVLTDGRIVATDPGKGVIFMLSADGRPTGIWKPESDAQPLGIAALPDGGFVFSDARRSEVQMVPASAISSLFR